MTEPTEARKGIKRGSRAGRMGGTAIAVVILLLLAGVGGGAWYILSRGGSGREIVRIDGSSTVFPITSAWAGAFNTPSRQVVVAFSGTGGGFQKWCRGETDLTDASRPIKAEEEALCATNGITGITEFLVAYDGLSIVVNKNNDWVDALTVEGLCRIWTSNTSAAACGGAGGRVTRWIELDAAWPDRTIGLYGPGTDSGTFDYFVEVILGNKKSEHTDQYFASEDDNALVTGVSSELDALGYFGFAYVVPNLAQLHPVPIDDGDPSNGDGPIEPTHDAIRNGTYAPLSRPLFVYAHDGSFARTIVKDFLRFGYTAQGMGLVAQTGYVDLTAPEIATQLAKIPA